MLYFLFGWDDNGKIHLPPKAQVWVLVVMVKINKYMHNDSWILNIGNGIVISCCTTIPISYRVSPGLFSVLDNAVIYHDSSLSDVLGFWLIVTGLHKLYTQKLWLTEEIGILQVLIVRHSLSSPQVTWEGSTIIIGW